MPVTREGKHKESIRNENKFEPPYNEDYTGLAARTWRLFSGEEPGPDHYYFERLICESGMPVLDVGCAHGRLLLPYMEAGMDRDGVEPSADMLALCRSDAGERGLIPRLFQQTLQTLSTDRQYKTILVPCGTLMLVPYLSDVFESLRRLFQHLETGGTLILTMYPERFAPDDQNTGWAHRMTKECTDGSMIVKHARAENWNLTEQTVDVWVRYRRLRGEEMIEEQLCFAPQRWYGKNEMTMMLKEAGFSDIQVTGDYSDAPASDAHSAWVFLTTK